MGIHDEKAVYFGLFVVNNIKCFKGRTSISLLDSNNEPCRWNVILGSNNTGKSTLLRLIANKNPIILDTKIQNKEEENKAIPDKVFENFTTKMINSLNVSSFSSMITKKKNNTVYIENPFYVFNVDSVSSGMVRDRYEYSKQRVINNRNDDSSLLNIDAFGTSRKVSESTLVDYSNLEETTRNLFFDEPLTNIEEWMLRLDYANQKGVEGAEDRLNQVIKILTGGILPDIKSITIKATSDFKAYILFETVYGKVPLKGLSHGYQSTIAWVIDLAKRMFDRYPDLENPLHGPAIVLVDEIDLHLHPEWQRKIIKYLSDLFPNTQFIVTAHSPLIVQSAENVNLIMLEKDDETGSINVRQQFGSFQGWTVEEILRELMDMGEKTRSDRYLELMRQFEDGLLNEDYTAVKTAYDALDKILSPSSHQRKVLQIQMSSLIPA